MDFGESWDGNFENDVYQDKFSRWDYQDADKVLDAIIEFMNKYGPGMDDSLKEDVLDFMLDKILGTAVDKRAKMIRTLIPPNHRKLQKVKEVGGTFLYRHQELQRSQAWLDDFGVCVDKVQAGISKIPYAGRGAFATRDIKNEELIMPVPMVPIGSDALFDMYDIVDGKNEQGQSTGLVYDFNKPRGKQLLYNYVFGHPESNMLLMPYGPQVTLINHGSLKSSANAYITWSKSDEMWNDHSLHDLSVADTMNQEYPVITMEVYAIRDIKEGEEILIDYGPEWEDAWAEYLKEYEASEAVKKNEWPLKGEDMREVFRNQSYPTGDPYPNGVGVACMVMVGDAIDGKPHETPEGEAILPWTGPEKFEDLYKKVVDYLSDKEVFVRDAYACSDPSYKLNIRVINEYPWSNQFAYNMFLRPTEEELSDFEEEWLVVNAPGFHANPEVDGTRQHNFAILDFTKKIALIGGTGYTGEIKKGVFSALNFILPVFKDTLPMHCSANVGKDGDTAIFFGLSGTGKTTLSTDPNRSLIGDDEHGWTADNQIFNFPLLAPRKAVFSIINNREHLGPVGTLLR